MTITVEVDPIAKGRPRFVRRGRSVHTFTPLKTRCFENHLVYALKSAVNGLKINDLKLPRSGAVSLLIVFYMPIPASRKHILGIESDCVPHTIKPDLDNLIKAATDAANGILWNDDAQIAHLTALKYYSSKPRIEYNIEVGGGD